MKRIHLIAIGGAIMHNMAIALQRKGYDVSGSDDAIYDPARSNLEREGLLPQIGWDPGRISSDIDQIILGMHARPDNPELMRAQELGIPIASFPEFVAQESKDKTRLVVAGSHGKTTTTSMIMHVLRKAGMEFDYLVGSSIDGFELSVRLTDAPLIVIEGDEYLSSPIDRRSKFLWYAPHISIITGIAYDHINVFPTFDSYLETFSQFIDLHHESTLIWYQKDEHLRRLCSHANGNLIPYNTPEYRNKNGVFEIIHEGRPFPLEIIGEHNLENLEAASLACEKLGISREDFFRYSADFQGAGRRMEKIFDSGNQVVYRDFAHSPSKLNATTKAVKNSYASELLAVFELHTFSSLNKEFLPLYKDSMIAADHAIVYIDPDVFSHRKMEPIALTFIRECFGSVEVTDDKNYLKGQVDQAFDKRMNILLMSSGTFSKTTWDFGS